MYDPFYLNGELIDPLVEMGADKPVPIIEVDGKLVRDETGQFGNDSIGLFQIRETTWRDYYEAL